MKLMLTRLVEIFPDLYKRPHNENDFYRICTKFKITVVYTTEVTNGLYIRFLGKDYIFLNFGLHGAKLLHVMFHELAHALFHAPAQSNKPMFEFFDKPEIKNQRSRKNHIEAETVAALLMLPTKELTNAMQNPEFEDRRLAELVALRLDVFSKTKK